METNIIQGRNRMEYSPENIGRRIIKIYVLSFLAIPLTFLMPIIALGLASFGDRGIKAGIGLMAVTFLIIPLVVIFQVFLVLVAIYTRVRLIGKVGYSRLKGRLLALIFPYVSVGTAILFRNHITGFQGYWIFISSVFIIPLFLHVFISCVTVKDATIKN